MDVGKMLKPVDQSEPPDPLSMPCTPQLTSEKIPDHDGPNSNDDEEEEEDEADVGPSKGKKKFTRTRRDWTVLDVGI